ncbi:MAG TPA: ATP-binding protein [Vicinamibacterales bacterium]|jgi:PAS domain S-box-containing protein
MSDFGVVIPADAQPLAALERERQFRAVFFDAADAMLILDDERTVLEANPAACALFSVAEDGVVGNTLDALIVDDDGELGVGWRELLALGEARREHHVAVGESAGGSNTRLVECSYRARVYANRHLCIARDITDRRLLEERLIQSEKIESVGRLAGGIAHDFNNLLTAILGYTELLLVRHEGNDPERGDLEEIQRAGQRAAALTQQLLAFSRKQVLMPKDVDLNQTVAGLKSMLGRLIREDITLHCELSPTAATIRIDPTQLEQAIINLVLNARDALPAGGDVRLEVTRVERPRSGVPADHLSAASEYIRLRVIDNGVGISPDAMAHLFEPFFTTKAVGKGTGLGLASVYGIVRQSNGFIAVESAPGSGSIFTMHFPAVATSAKDCVEAAGSSNTAPGFETILLVEDEDSVRGIIGAVLRRQGYHVLEAATPRAALDLFKVQAGKIDLLLSDVVMPEMSGPALAQQLIGVCPELRVLLISGYTEMAIPFDSNSPGINFIGKPFRSSVLTERIREILGTRPGHSRISRDGQDIV